MRMDMKGILESFPILSKRWKTLYLIWPETASLNLVGHEWNFSLHTDFHKPISQATFLDFSQCSILNLFMYCVNSTKKVTKDPVPSQALAISVSLDNYHPPTKLQEGNVFIGVCQSVHWEMKGDLTLPRD